MDIYFIGEIEIRGHSIYPFIYQFVYFYKKILIEQENCCLGFSLFNFLAENKKYN